MARLISEDDVMRMLTGVELNNGTITDAKIELRNVKTAYSTDKVVEDILKTKSVYGRIPVSEAIKIQKYEQPTISEDTLEMERMKALNEGRNEVWELADKLNNMPMQDIIDIYGFNVDRCSVYSKITPQEALAKLETYEKKIEVGDVVRLKGSDKEYVVTTIDEDRCSEIYCGVSKDGRWFSQCNVEKTGKHIDIQSVLEQIAE